MQGAKNKLNMQQQIIGVLLENLKLPYLKTTEVYMLQIL